MDIAQGEFARQLARDTKTHDDWVAVMRFGMETLLAGPHEGRIDYLAEMVAEEAVRMDGGKAGEPKWETVRKLMWELGLRFSR
jgi:hypothetical protein